MHNLRLSIKIITYIYQPGSNQKYWSALQDFQDHAAKFVLLHFFLCEAEK